MSYINQRVLKVAMGKEKADTVIKGGRVINVYTQRIMDADVAIADDRIASLGNVEHCMGKQTKIFDASGKLLSPGFIDAHIHPEVSKVTPSQFARAVLPKGTTAIVCSLDQVGTTEGINGMRWFLDAIKQTPLKMFHAGPSRLPYTKPSSKLAYEFGVKEHAVAQKWEEAIGTWEYLSNSIEDLESDVLEAAEMAINNRLGLHGHAPMVRGPQLDVCLAAGMRSEHETANTLELAEKLDKGLFGIMRRGTHTDNLIECVRTVTEMGLPTRRLSLCTDDVDCIDLIELGHLDYLVRYVIKMGIEPITAIQMATINAAETYKIDHLIGGITPGRLADILVIDNLTDFHIETVFANGREVARDGTLIESIESPVYPTSFKDSFHINKTVTAEDIYLSTEVTKEQTSAFAIILKFIERVYRRHLCEVTLPVHAGRVFPDPSEDVLYVSVTNRHSEDGETRSGFIKGFNLKKGALATSVSPDDNNIVCIGASVEDMTVAINHVVSMKGGQVVVCDGKVLNELPLPICGVMADISVENMANKERELNLAARELGTSFLRPFFRMQFLAITGSPGYSITDRGLVDNAQRKVINPLTGE